MVNGNVRIPDRNLRTSAKKCLGIFMTQLVQQLAQPDLTTLWLLLCRSCLSTSFLSYIFHLVTFFMEDIFKSNELCVCKPAESTIEVVITALIIV